MEQLIHTLFSYPSCENLFPLRRYGCFAHHRIHSCHMFNANVVILWEAPQNRQANYEIEFGSYG